jgi:hypothetical protein
MRSRPPDHSAPHRRKTALHHAARGRNPFTDFSSQSGMRDIHTVKNMSKTRVDTLISDQARD